MSSYEIEFYNNASERFEEQYWQNVDAFNYALTEYWETISIVFLCMLIFSFISSFIVLWLTHDK